MFNIVNYQKNANLSDGSLRYVVRIKPIPQG